MCRANKELRTLGRRGEVAIVPSANKVSSGDLFKWVTAINHCHPFIPCLLMRLTSVIVCYCPSHKFILLTSSRYDKHTFSRWIKYKVTFYFTIGQLLVVFLDRSIINKSVPKIYLDAHLPFQLRQSYELKSSQRNEYFVAFVA